MARALINRRTVLAGGGAFGLTGCVAEVGPQDAGGSPPSAQAQVSPGPRPRFDSARALTPEDARDLQIVSVNVRLAEDFTRTAPQNGVTDTFILDAFERTVPRGLLAANPGGVYPVLALVEILRFSFANVVSGIVMQNKSSFAALRTTLVFADTGAPVGRPAISLAKTRARPSLLGLLAIKEASEEVRIVAGRAPQSIALRLFGRSPS